MTHSLYRRILYRIFYIQFRFHIHHNVLHHIRRYILQVFRLLFYIWYSCRHLLHIQNICWNIYHIQRLLLLNRWFKRSNLRDRYIWSLLFARPLHRRRGYRWNRYFSRHIRHRIFHIRYIFYRLKI